MLREKRSKQLSIEKMGESNVDLPEKFGVSNPILRLN